MNTRSLWYSGFLSMTGSWLSRSEAAAKNAFQNEPRSLCRQAPLWLLCLLAITTLPVQASELVQTIKQVKPSIVGVGTFQATRRPPAKLMGTGFVIGDGTYVATNYHVVAAELDSEKLESLAVFVGRGKQSKATPATLVAKSSRHDLAILKIPVNLQPLQLADSALMPEGSDIAFTGFPIGVVLGLYPVTNKGIISSVSPIAIPTSSSGQLDAKKINRLRNPVEIYQLDAIAYPGNSGSPVYRVTTGEVIGVINMVHVKETKEDILSKPSAISYAVPIRHLKTLMQDLP